MTLVPLPAFADNYIWMLHDGSHAIVVDPGDAQPVFDALARHKLQLAAILVTHHHADHTGGVGALHAATGAPVWGPARERIPEPYTPLVQGDVAEALGLRFEVIDVPGHTAGHIAYFLPAAPSQAPLLFCGDTLFSGGCGRLFEGTPAQMLASLDALAALPGDTRVCCAHEYTLSNLRFALAVEPANADLTHYNARCESLRAQGQPTLPSQLATERRINPFLRSREATVLRAVRAYAELAADAAEADVFAALRQWKNDFR
ncbi:MULTISPECIES: hydroxyacylglutathione hydrolase [Variovorax]|jgi:hydroxyacylglutathione hydrolase|uniref:hydroxyacylglutathione hydrolase n=1 Tax=Variovorax TaxID=34072 RepID=UPI00086832E0|nr:MULTISPECIES: hydroxyacylglutathione hydrolase [Variovorax]MBN8754909.1 hydroxyacylglutathione hydrolase [Variovorax sp.]ODU11704.1 MAG: hydroxyacylglutathione hydrolase [Variovorax sp. SCN 67-85]ODV14932.1 MAG: hydroxyacylglutathione hydrolase [Variovorax sp. SCN 67-20]OJZ05350.1 MAG: hydroxyacylglutathione hydrolase [Variovorax sp. 67-131]UKI05204.1 hydroxyacylglutathione hydrolase [Variovorax paradoxus]